MEGWQGRVRWREERRNNGSDGVWQGRTISFLAHISDREGRRMMFCFSMERVTSSSSGCAKGYNE
jgi:hypothetical protein